MANPENIEDLQFALTYEAAQGDPTDPNVDWDTISFVAGVGQPGLDQASYQRAYILQQIEETGGTNGIRNPRVVYAAQVAWNVWEQEEVTPDGTDQ